ncbi:MAG: DUF5721 family protein [Lachnospira sp.]|nr:DUF5721 family protein [Lachnospira sp.]MDD5828442.1 DUF5721 family protein [Lachnospira sp.]
MISLNITDVRHFMSQLLVGDTFKSLYLSEADITTGISYTINGNINRSFYTDEEFSELKDTTYTRWGNVQSLCFEIIKGKKVPSSMKIVFLLPDEDVNSIINADDINISPSDINGLFINIRYTNGTLNLVTGTSLKIFSMDKSIDRSFDSYVRGFLDEADIAYEEM